MVAIGLVHPSPKLGPLDDFAQIEDEVLFDSSTWTSSDDDVLLAAFEGTDSILFGSSSDPDHDILSANYTQGLAHLSECDDSLTLTSAAGFTQSSAEVDFTTGLDGDMFMMPTDDFFNINDTEVSSYLDEALSEQSADPKFGLFSGKSSLCSSPAPISSPSVKAVNPLTAAATATLPKSSFSIGKSPLSTHTSTLPSPHPNARQSTMPMKAEEYKCAFTGCNRSFTTATNLKRHEVSHQPAPRYTIPVKSSKLPCNTCGKSFTRYNELSAHKATCGISHPQSAPGRPATKADTNVKIYNCTFPSCGKTFAKQYELNIHKSTHGGVKPHVCDYEGCRKSFLRRSDLKTHYRTHTGERPYVCSFPSCGHSATTSSNLRKHERTHGVVAYLKK
eukprot:GFYU01002199.1.p1 GENE.GFYU01002199.1~~GFYU01002199.1.p1  ORF type:complete len:390 (+),score=102.00 GFYU01002199.1:351-1520(+)